MRHLAAEALEMLVHPPHRGRDPTEAALDEDELQFWKALRHALDHEAGKLRRNRVRVGLVLLDIIGRPAATGRRMPAIAADMDAERQAQRLGTFVDWPIAAAAERLVGARRDVDLDVLADFRAAFDLGNGEINAVLADQDRSFQTRVAMRPERQLPVVDGALDRGAEFEVLLREDEEIEHLQNPELDVERIEMLLLHEGEIRAGRSAGRRPGIAARDQRRRARIGRGEQIGRAQMAAIFLQMLLPPLWQELVEIVGRMQAWMHIAIDDAQPRSGGLLIFPQRAVDDLTHANLQCQLASDSRGNVSSGLSTHIFEMMLFGRFGGIGSSPSNCLWGWWDANRNIWSEPIWSMISSTLLASPGASNGCIVTRKLSRMIAAGSRSTQGTSTRTPRQVLLARHMKAGSQLTPDSISTTLRSGYLPNTPS